MIVESRYHLPSDIRERLEGRPVPWGFGELSAATFYRTYSRSNDHQETWADTVCRVVEGTLSIRQDWLRNVLGKRWPAKRYDALAAELAEAIFEMRFLPPGRGLWAMGTEYVYERGAMSLQNCGYVEVGPSLATAARWAMDALMCGVGVGFSTHTATVRRGRPRGEPYVYEVPDTKEGWAESVKRLIQSYERSSRPVTFDYSKVRPAGSPIHGFGGISAGPEPLRVLHERLRGYLEREDVSSTRLVTDVMNAIGACVVSGNVRRSAEIALGSPSDGEFLDLKNYAVNADRAEIGWMSNNSVVLSERDHFGLLPDLADRIRDNGEPGIFNLMNVQKYGRLGEKRPDEATGTNPCVTGDTLIAVADGRGAVRADELARVGEDVPVYTFTGTGIHSDGIRQGVHPRLTGRDVPVLRVTFDNGVSVRVTPNHRFLLLQGEERRADELRPGQAVKSFTRRRYRDWWQAGRCTCSSHREHRQIAHFLGRNAAAVHHRDHDGLNNRWDNLEFTDTTSHVGHHMIGAANPRHRFTTEQEARLRVSRPDGYDVPWSGGPKGDPRLAGKKGALRTLTKICEGCGNSFEVSWRKREVMFCSRKCWRSRTPRRSRASTGRAPNVKVVSIEPAGTADVYSITVEDSHNYATGTLSETGEFNGVYSANCGEQPLGSYETCCLVEVFPTRCRSDAEIWRTMELATFYASTAALLRSHSQETNEIIAHNRRIGVSVSGVADWLDSTSVSHVFDVLNRGYDRVREANRRLASEAGVAESVRVTTVKPSGTVSLLAGVSSGMHFPIGGYVLRRVRVAETSPVAATLTAAGVPHERDVVSANTVVFEFPLRYGSGRTRPVKDVSIYEQAAIVAMLQRGWSDNAVSNTLTVQPAELSQVERVLALFAPQVKSLSLLPDVEGGVYAQMPIEPLTRDEFETRTATLRVVDWSSLRGSDGEDSRYCTDDHCEL